MALRPDGSSETPAPLSAVDRERMVLRHMADEGSSRVRILGLVGMALGLILLMIIGAVAYYTVPIILAGGDSVDGSRFNAEPAAALLVFAIYGIVAAIGVMAMVNGALNAVTGRRFPAPLRLMLTFASLFVLAGMAARLLD
ncbi:MAG: hypothetical protein ABIS39_00100 [Sphingomicrobium sp.]